MRYLILLVCIISNVSLWAQDDLGLVKILNQLNLEDKDIMHEFVRIKALPYKTEDVIYVIPEIIEEDDDGYSYTLQPHIVIIDSYTDKIKATYLGQEEWTSDALYISDVTIDTAPYMVRNDQRAFGIRLSTIGSSKPNPYNDTYLCLYVIENNTIRQVLKNVEVKSFWGEWDTFCAGEFTRSNCILIISENQTNDYNDIILKCNLVETEATPTDDDYYENPNYDCTEIKTASSSKTIIKYSEGMYQSKY